MAGSDAAAPRSPPRSTAGTLVYLLLGPILWAAHLAVIYGAHAALCALGGSAATASATTATMLATVAALALLAGAVVARRALSRRLHAADWPPPAQRFCDRAMVLLVLLSSFGVIWAGAAILLVPACAPLR